MCEIYELFFDFLIIFLNLPPYLTTGDPQALSDFVLGIQQHFDKVSSKSDLTEAFSDSFSFCHFFAELTSFGANYSTLTVEHNYRGRTPKRVSCDYLCYIWCFVRRMGLEAGRIAYASRFPPRPILRLEALRLSSLERRYRMVLDFLFNRSAHSAGPDLDTPRHTQTWSFPTLFLLRKVCCCNKFCFIRLISCLSCLNPADILPISCLYSA